MTICVYPRWPSEAILDFMETEIAPFDPPPRKPWVEQNMEWIGFGSTICEIFDFNLDLYYDLETEVRGHSRSSKAALFDRAHTNLYSSSIVNIPLSITVSKAAYWLKMAIPPCIRRPR